MKTHTFAFVALLGCLPWLSACGNQKDVNLDTSGVIAEAMTDVSAEVDQALATENISISDDNDRTEAEITPQGDLMIDGRKVEVTPAQRALLLEYRGQVAGIAKAGAAIGMQGASLASKAVGQALAGAFSGNTDEMEKSIEAEASKIEAEALKLCSRLPAMHATQQALAAALPEFKPYATMTQDDVDDCSSNEIHTR